MIGANGSTPYPVKVDRIVLLLPGSLGWSMLLAVQLLQFTKKTCLLSQRNNARRLVHGVLPYFRCLLGLWLWWANFAGIGTARTCFNMLELFMLSTCLNTHMFLLVIWICWYCFVFIRAQHGSLWMCIFFTITYRPSRHPAGTYALPGLRLRRFREAQARKAALARDRQGESETPKMQPGRACLVLAFLSSELLEVASSRFARGPLSYLI